jgi:urease accessory protein
MDWLVLQLADSAFPAGGFTHSQGLEAAYQRGEIRSEAALVSWLHALCWQTAFGFLPLVRAVHLRPESCAEIDAAADAFLTNHVANRASRQQGHALIATAETAFGGTDLAAVLRSVQSESQPGHLGPLFGVVTRALGVSEPDARRIGLIWVVRGALSAAVRLGIVGPLAAQRLQRDLGIQLDAAWQASASLDVGDLAQTAPLLDLTQMTHDRLYSRLFQS